MLNKKAANGETMYDNFLGYINTKLLDKFDNDEYKLISEFYNKIPEMSPKDIDKIVKMSRKKEIVQLALITHPEVSDDIIKEVLSHGRVYQSVLKYLTFKKTLSPDNANLVTYLAKPKLFQDALDILRFMNGVTVTNKNINPAVSDYYIKGYSGEKINENVMAIICSNACDKATLMAASGNIDVDLYQETFTNVEFSSFQLANLTLIENKINELKKYSDLLPSEIVDYLLNNETLKPEIKQYFLETSNYDLLNVHSFTKNEMKSLYNANVDNSLNVKRGESYYCQTTANSIIEKIIKDKENGFPFALDYGKRCFNLNFNLTRLGVTIFTSLIRTTKDQELLRTLYNESKKTERADEWLYVFMINRDLPKDVLQDVVNRHIENIANNKFSFKRKGNLANPTQEFIEWDAEKIAATAKCMSKIELTENQCRILYNALNLEDISNDSSRYLQEDYLSTLYSRYLLTLIFNDNTPQDILNDIYKFPKTTQTLTVAGGITSINYIAQLDKVLRENNVDNRIETLNSFLYNAEIYDLNADITDAQLLHLKNLKEILSEEKNPDIYKTNFFFRSCSNMVNDKVNSIETEEGRIEKQMQKIDCEILDTMNGISHLFQLYTNYDKIYELYQDRQKTTIEWAKLITVTPDKDIILEER